MQPGPAVAGAGADEPGNKGQTSEREFDDVNGTEAKFWVSLTAAARKMVIEF
jgi:hypothetical protein